MCGFSWGLSPRVLWLWCGGWPCQGSFPFPAQAVKIQLLPPLLAASGIWLEHTPCSQKELRLSLQSEGHKPDWFTGSVDERSWWVTLTVAAFPSLDGHKEVSGVPIALPRTTVP